MFIEIVRIPLEGTRIVGEDPSSVLDMDEEECIRPDGPMGYDLKAWVSGDELIVRGSVQAEVLFRCSRCAEFFSLAVKEPAFECVRRIDDRSEPVDLTPDLREAIILALPNYPLCRSECKGLCSQCGVNLNSRRCECRPPGDVRWSALDNLRDTG
jgi:uncharacterized metal-binding protein YceD (DUF177 family)